MSKYTKRQITEALKRHDILSGELSCKANINSIGINFEEGVIYFSDKDNFFKEYILATFWDYKSLKAAQNYLIKLLKVVDQVLNSDHVLRMVHK